MCLSHLSTEHEVVQVTELAGKRVHGRRPAPAVRSGSAWDDWWRSFLELGLAPQPDSAREVTIADLFCGAGGLTLGAREAAHAMGYRTRVTLAVDKDARALAVYRNNHAPEVAIAGEVQPDRARPAGVERQTLVLAGPPCEGHSNLNNWTRYDDPRNSLIVTAARAAVALDPEAIVIENVPTAVHDATRSLHEATRILEEYGYSTTVAVLGADVVGWPQRRRRLFVIASRQGTPPVARVVGALARTPKPIMWAIGDLVGKCGGFMDEPAALTPDNERRVRWLHEHGELDLPDELRIPSHRRHRSYRAMGGRLRPDEPAPTITSGFMSPNRGRFVHPTEPRTLTLHEGARIQGFPDTYDWTVDGKPPARRRQVKWIGNAVPPVLAYVATTAALLPRFYHAAR